jgi:photosystem II stability/assembly factor-like uncharacterized protein
VEWASRRQRVQSSPPALARASSVQNEPKIAFSAPALTNPLPQGQSGNYISLGVLDIMRFLPALAVLAAMSLAAQSVDVTALNNLEYRYVGPANMGGRTTDVEGVPGNPAIVYVGTGGGGLWKTVNGGTTWTPIFERQGTYSIGDLALDPRNPDVIWLGTGEANMRNSVSFGDGMYKSTDGGKNWTHLGLKETEHIARVLVSPLDSNTAWVCAIGHQAAPNEERGVFMTSDGGKTWQKTLYVDDKHGCADLDVDPNNPNVLFAAMWRFERKPWNHTSGSEQSGIFRSIDGGRTWKKLDQGLPKLIGRAGVKVAPSNSNVVYVACESKEGTLYRSVNGGDTWQEMTREREVVSRGFYYADLRVDPRDENRVYAVASALQVSIDSGKTWRNIVGGTHIDYHSLWIDPKDPNRMWQGQDGGIAVSYDRGNTWEAVTNIPLGQFYQIFADNALPFYNVSGGLQDNGSWRGPSRVRQPSGITNAEWTMVSFGDGFFAAALPGNPDILLTESQGGSIQLSDLKSGSSQPVSPQPRQGRVRDLKYRFNWNTPIVASPHGTNSIFFGSNVLFQSRDFGKSWEPISGDLTTNDAEKLKDAGGPIWLDNSTAENHCTIISVNESPAKAGVIWAGTDDGNVQVTFDGGAHWTNVAANVPGVPKFSPVSHVEPSRTGQQTAYIAFDRHLFDDYQPYIFKTTDGGKTWTRLTNGLPDHAYIQIVREDPKNTNLLYAGTELGLFASWDGGKNWQSLLLKNLSKVAVHDIVIHPRDNDLILATHGRSVVIFDDAAPIQQFTTAIAGSAAYLFDVRPALRYATPMRTYGLGAKPYRGPNPPYGAIITYSLKEKLDPKADMKLEVLDAAGKVIRKIDRFPREKGLNRASWDLRFDGATLRTPPTTNEVEFGGGPRGPLAVPGTYTIRLTAAGQTLEKQVVVTLDSDLKATPADLKALLDLSLKLSDWQNSLNTALKKLDGLRAQLANTEKLDAAWTPKINDLRKALDEETLKLGMKPGGSRLEDPPRLAEDVNSLYQQLAGLNAAPTAAQTAYASELEPKVKAALAAAQDFFANTVPTWNDQLRAAGAPTLVIR